MSLAVHFSSKSNEWETPQDFFDQLNSEFHFELDVCAMPENAKCPRYFTPAEDGLKQEWRGVCWMNPPYGREIGRWVKKAYESAKDGATVVFLLPARTDTSWWHDYCMMADEIRFIRGRLKFGGAKHPAPFPSAVVVFRPNKGEEKGEQMIDSYLIKIDDKYFVDTNDEDFGKVPVGGWYDTGGSIGGVILSTEKEKARIIEGNINLKSYFNRIYDATRYGTFKFNKLEIVRVKNE